MARFINKDVRTYIDRIENDMDIATDRIYSIGAWMYDALMVLQKLKDNGENLEYEDSKEYIMQSCRAFLSRYNVTDMIKDLKTLEMYGNGKITDEEAIRRF